MQFSWRRLLLGDPIPRKNLDEQAISKVKALPILSSDALSSVAYATGEILTVLVLAGTTALSKMPHIAILISLLILIVAVSYRQAIHAYPKGGGAYTVARENFGVKMSLIAAGSLMIDYVLTVAVSVTAGVFSITSAFPILASHVVALSVIAVIIITWMNLRGVQESATAFMAPTYLFVAFTLLMIGVGIFRYFTHSFHPVQYTPTSDFFSYEGTAPLTTLLILRAFSSGCSAMTGIEAISNSVSVFQKPAAENAEKTLLYLAMLLITLFLGVSFLAFGLHIVPLNDQSVLSQMGHAIFGNGFLYYGLQVSTCLILLLAANTSFTGFPRLASLISRDGYLPRPLQALGDRLAFSNGIMILALLAIILIVLFDANTHKLIPLYSVGVFLAFTICQAGLIKVWWRRRKKGWIFKLSINTFGAIATGIAVLVILDSKFTEGAWLFIVAMPIIMLMFYKIYQHYQTSDREMKVSYAELTREDEMATVVKPNAPKVVVPLSKIHKGTLAALEFAFSLSDDVTAISIDIGEGDAAKLRKAWENCGFSDEQLVILKSPYLSVIEPLITRIRRIDLTNPEAGLAIVVMPKALPAKWWQNLLHNHHTFMLRHALYELGRTEYKGQARIIVEVPYQLH